MPIVSTYPVNLKYSYGPGVSAKNASFSTTEGIFFNLMPLLSSANDATFNQGTISVLTDNFSFAESVVPRNNIVLTSITTQSVIKIGDEYVKATATANNVPTHTSSKSEAALFTFTFDTNNNKVNILYAGLYLTVDGSNPLKLAVKDNANFTTTQTFNYNLYENKIALFAVTNNKIVYHYGIPNLQLQTFGGFTDQNTLILERLTHTDYSELGESNNVTYNKASNDINIRYTTDKLKYNYLVTAPYETVTQDNVLSFNITPLKNYYSPEHIQTPTLSTQLRHYNKIFTGLNNCEGYDKIYLGYEGHETTKTFFKDTDTYFHYPVSATNIALSASTLVKSGARPGSSPWRSDRLFVRRANYRNYSNWGTFNGQEDGTYFCSWLSASEVGAEPVWMDRYFDPAYVNTTIVLASTGIGFSNNNFPNVIWDVPTTQIFNPECLYVYHRIGDNDNIAVVNTLSGSLIHYIKNWTNPLIDEVSGLSAGSISNFGSNSVLTYPLIRDKALNTEVSYAKLAFTNDDFNSAGITLAFNAYNNDWSNVQGDQIVGNFYGGGLGLFKSNPLLTPFISVVGKGINTLNVNLVPLNVSSSVDYTGSSKNYVLKGSHDESYFVLDSNKNVYEYDQDGALINKFDANQPTLTGTIIGAQLIRENNVRKILIVSVSGSTLYWRKFKTNGTIGAGDSDAVNNVSNYIFNLSNQFCFYNASGNGTVNSKNETFALSGDIVVKNLPVGSDVVGNRKFILSARQAEYIACDHEDNIWITYSGRSLCKMDSYGSIKWDVNLTSDPYFDDTITQPRVVNFVAELDPTTNALAYYGLVLDNKTQNVFKVNTDTGAVISTYKASPTFTVPLTAAVPINCKVLGDSTGYDYQRRYKYIGSKKTHLKVKALLNNVTINEPEDVIKELTFDAASLLPGWHHFAITLDTRNNLKLYVDGASAASTQVGDLSAFYKVRNKRNNPDLIIGTSSFKTDNLSEYTKMSSDPYNFNGSICDVRFYSEALFQADIKALLKRARLDSFSDLEWAAPTGRRYYIEGIERFFPHRMPGAKSHMFNIRIKNSNIDNPDLRSIIEKNITTVLSKTTPVYTKLNKIIWE